MRIPDIASRNLVKLPKLVRNSNRKIQYFIRLLNTHRRRGDRGAPRRRRQGHGVSTGTAGRLSARGMEPLYGTVGPSAQKHTRVTFEIAVKDRSVVVFDVVCAVGARRAGFSPLLSLWSARVEARPERRSGPRRPSRCDSFGSGGPRGTSSWDPSRDAIAEVLIASHGFESTL